MILVNHFANMDLLQPNTTLPDCILYLMQHFHDPGILRALQISVSLESVSELQSVMEMLQHAKSMLQLSLSKSESP